MISETDPIKTFVDNYFPSLTNPLLPAVSFTELNLSNTAEFDEWSKLQREDSLERRILRFINQHTKTPQYFARILYSATVCGYYIDKYGNEHDPTPAGVAREVEIVLASRTTEFRREVDNCLFELKSVGGGRPC